VARVVYAVADPNPHVAGRGAEALRCAGVEVVQGFDPASQREVEHLLKPWSTFITRARAHVTLKLAMTLDGRIATRSGESRWITSAASRRDAHALRATCDAIMVGSKTVLADDPRLTAREVPVEGAGAVRVVIDSALVTPTTSQLALTARDVPTWVCTVEDGTHPKAHALTMCGVEVLSVARREGRVDLADALRVLASRGVVSALCEGGGALHGALLDAQLADRVVCYIAPCIVGGVSATPAVGGLGVAALAEAYRVEAIRVSHTGNDLKIEGELHCSQGSFKP
jgi:diaminohydroxyphosphoribosylaminopyrimidine deaminase/5-amino-6-(5-phosphoribosylamino)uracil reductase